jgi:hypothetical protein
MRSLLTLGVITLAMTFCGLGERLKGLTGGGTAPGSNSASNSSNSTTNGPAAEKPTLTASQQAIQDVKKESFNYGSPANGFLIASISVMPDSFPADASIKATYDSALEQLKQGNYEQVQWLEIDGVKGVEWTEALKEKDGIRRHQWIAFRRFQGQNQQLNVMVSTTGPKFDKQKDTFAAIMYSMKIAKG